MKKINKTYPKAQMMHLALFGPLMGYYCLQLLRITVIDGGGELFVVVVVVVVVVFFDYNFFVLSLLGMINNYCKCWHWTCKPLTC